MQKSCIFNHVYGLRQPFRPPLGCPPSGFACEVEKAPRQRFARLGGPRDDEDRVVAGNRAQDLPELLLIDGLGDRLRATPHCVQDDELPDAVDSGEELRQEGAK